MNPVAYKRIPKEIEKVRDLSGLGIYYVSDTDSMLKGHAMILGPEGSPYANCLFFFRFLFPKEYPFSPPSVEFLTTDGRTRFHPNLYVCGKVCLSILGTFPGPSWQSTMSLSMILVSLQALLDDNPLRNEPGYSNLTLKDARAREFRDYVEYKSIQYTLEEYSRKQYLQLFEEDCAETLKKRAATLLSYVKTKRNTPNASFANLVYGMSGTVNWNLLDIDRDGA